MTAFRGGEIFKYLKVQFQFHNSFCTTSSRYNVWRLKQGLEPNPNSYGPLRNLPDFSFVDGRPVPLGYQKQLALERQKQYCKQIVELTKELEDGLKIYYENEKIKEEERQNVLKNKLKAKGVQLLEKTNQIDSEGQRRINKVKFLK